MTIQNLERTTRFGYFRPDTLSDAIGVLAEHAPRGRPLAGGTDVLVEYRETVSGDAVLVDIGRLAEPSGVEVTTEGLRIGSLTTHSTILEEPLFARYAPAMVQAARVTGSVQIRNRGTIGGNLCTAVPAMDGGPSLFVLGAVATVVGPRGERSIPIAEMFSGPRNTVLEPDELLVSITVPKAMLGRPQAFWKFGLRKGQALALVNAAASVGVTDDGMLADPRISLGAVAPTVIRATAAEDVLSAARTPAEYEEVVSEAAAAAVADAEPIDDFRASAAYRRDLIEVGVRRVVRAAVAEAARRVGAGED